MSGTRRRVTGVGCRRAVLRTNGRMDSTLFLCSATSGGLDRRRTRISRVRGTIRVGGSLFRTKGTACLRVVATRRSLLDTRLGRMSSAFRHVRTIVGLCDTLNNKHRWLALGVV